MSGAEHSGPTAAGEIRQRRLHIEVLRIIAAFFVIFNHTGDLGYTLFQTYERSHLRYWFYLCFSVACKVSVPLFFMISGALLLQRENEPWKKNVWRIVRILIVLLVFSILSYIQQILFGNEEPDFKRFFVVLISSTWMSPYWYLYSYLGFLLSLPLLRKIAKTFTNNNFQYMLALVISLTGLVPVLMYIISRGQLNLNPDFSIVWISSQICFYPLAGYYVENRLNVGSVDGRKIMILWIINSLSMFLTCYVTDLQNALSAGFPQTFMMAFSPINAVCIYITAKKLFANCKDRIGWGIIREIGSCTFGIYLFHGLLLRDARISLYAKIDHYFQLVPLIRISLRCVEIMIIAGIVTWILKRIPGVKKFL